MSSKNNNNSYKEVGDQIQKKKTWQQGRKSKPTENNVMSANGFLIVYPLSGCSESLAKSAVTMVVLVAGVRSWIDHSSLNSVAGRSLDFRMTAWIRTSVPFVGQNRDSVRSERVNELASYEMGTCFAAPKPREISCYYEKELSGNFGQESWLGAGVSPWWNQRALAVALTCLTLRRCKKIHDCMPVNLSKKNGDFVFSHYYRELDYREPRCRNQQNIPE